LKEKEMVELPLQTRVVLARIRSTGSEGCLPGLDALVAHWTSIVAGECNRAQPDAAEIKVAAAQALLVLMEIASKLDCDLLRLATEVVRKREIKLPPPKPEADCGHRPGKILAKSRKS
jgi:hypothetical protein